MSDASSKKRKGLLRKPAVQVELDLPPPAGPSVTEFVEFEPEWWQRRWFWSSRWRASRSCCWRD